MQTISTAKVRRISLLRGPHISKALETNGNKTVFTPRVFFSPFLCLCLSFTVAVSVCDFQFRIETSFHFEAPVSRKLMALSKHHHFNVRELCTAPSLMLAFIPLVIKETRNQVRLRAVGRQSWVKVPQEVATTLSSVAKILQGVVPCTFVQVPRGLEHQKVYASFLKETSLQQMHLYY